MSDLGKRVGISDRSNGEENIGTNTTSNTSKGRGRVFRGSEKKSNIVISKRSRGGDGDIENQLFFLLGSKSEGLIEMNIGVNEREVREPVGLKLGLELGLASEIIGGERNHLWSESERRIGKIMNIKYLSDTFIGFDGDLKKSG